MLDSQITVTKLLVPDVVIMDVHMPGMNRIEATRAIHTALPQVGVVGLSMTDEAGYRDAMRQAGRSGLRQQDRASRCGD